MSDPVTHFVENNDSTRAPCGVPIKNGQIFLRGRPLSATTVPSAVTCDGCSVRADEVAAELAAAQKAQDAAAAAEAQEDAKRKARELLGLPEGGS